MEPESRIVLCSPLFITAANLLAPLFLPPRRLRRSAATPASSAAKQSATAEIANRPPTAPLASRSLSSLPEPAAPRPARAGAHRFHSTQKKRPTSSSSSCTSTSWRTKRSLLRLLALLLRRGRGRGGGVPPPAGAGAGVSTGSMPLPSAMPPAPVVNTFRTERRCAVVGRGDAGRCRQRRPVGVDDAIDGRAARSVERIAEERRLASRSRTPA